MNVTSLLSAAAATLAAALAAINLYVLGRRERHRWLRETLIDEYAAYLKASFSATSKAKEYAKIASLETGSEPRMAVDRDVKNLHDQQMDILTRLRLLAPPEAVAAAAEVHRADHAVVSLLSNSGGSPSKSHLKAARQNAHARREDLIRVARESMKVPGKVAKVEEV